jgi:hypothetical protein
VFKCKGICKMKKLLLLLVSVGFYVQAEVVLRCIQIGRLTRCVPREEFDEAMARNRARSNE